MWNTLLITSGVGLTLGAAVILTHDVAQELRHQRSAGGNAPPATMLRIRWRTTLAFAMLAWAPLLLALGLLVSACGAGPGGIG
jgi:hypothetical protein